MAAYKFLDSLSSFLKSYPQTPFPPPPSSLCSTSVKLVEIGTGRKRKLDAHLAGGVGALCFSQCGQYLAVSAAGVREVLLFDIQAGAQSGPMQVQAVNGVPRRLLARSRTAGTAEDGEMLVDVLVLFEDAGGCVIRVPSGGMGVEPRISELETSEGDRGCVLAGAFCKGGKSAEGASTRDWLAYAVGTPSDPFFGEVSFGAKDDGLAAAVMLADAKQAGENGHRGADAAGANLGGPSILGPHEMSGKRRLVVGEETSAQASSSSKKSRVAGPDEDDDDETEELTLEQRLESLSAGIDALERAATHAPRDRDDPAPTSDSLVTLLDQGLQTGDDALLEQCLACDDADVVDATASRLPVSRVVPLLRKLMAKFEKRPARGMLLTRWLVSILRHHMAFLISVPELAAQLAGLSQILEQRLACHVSLAALGGRLDLLMSQVASGADGGAGGSFVPKAVYMEE